MKKILTLALGFTALAANAQETYESAQLATQDLNGTAKYIGMGGAMEALGADISTMSTNPAGIGLMRHSTASVSFGLVSQNGVEEFDGLKSALRGNRQFVRWCDERFLRCRTCFYGHWIYIR